jgi:glycosyltransferase involved in cell wall biosynthesis
MLLVCIRQAAWSAIRYHTGRFADGGIENVALSLGVDLDARWAAAGDGPPFRPSRAEPTSRRRILHVATTVEGVGGHTRVIKNWIRLDPVSCHSLLIVRQGGAEVPSWLLETVQRSGGNLVVLPMGAPPSAKAKWLREIAQSSSDLVVLHHHPDDVVPIVAFAVGGGPPVAVLNHADHIFWLGSTVADSVINLREIGRDLSERRRFTRRNVVLPIPLEEPPSRFPRTEVRRLLGIPDDQVVLLSTGTPYKYIPSDGKNFFETASKILDRNTTAHIYLLGVTRGDVARYLRAEPHERLHYLGRIEDPSVYQAYRIAADVYMEGFPFGSPTALLEACLAGVPPVPAFAPGCNLLATSDEAISDLAVTPATELEYIERVEFLVRNLSDRETIGAEVRRRVLECHTGDGWAEALESVYSGLVGLAHEPGPIPVAEPLETEIDVAMCAWRKDWVKVAGSGEGPASEVRGLLLDAARQARQWGEHADGLRLLRYYGGRWGYDRQVLREIAKTLVHRVGIARTLVHWARGTPSGGIV